MASEKWLDKLKVLKLVLLVVVLVIFGLIFVGFSILGVRRFRSRNAGIKKEVFRYKVYHYDSELKEYTVGGFTSYKKLKDEDLQHHYVALIGDGDDEKEKRDTFCPPPPPYEDDFMEYSVPIPSDSREDNEYEERLVEEDKEFYDNIFEESMKEIEREAENEGINYEIIDDFYEDVKTGENDDDYETEEKVEEKEEPEIKEQEKHEGELDFPSEIVTDAELRLYQCWGMCALNRPAHWGDEVQYSERMIMQTTQRSMADAYTEAHEEFWETCKKVDEDFFYCFKPKENLYEVHDVVCCDVEVEKQRMLDEELDYDGPGTYTFIMRKSKKKTRWPQDPEYHY